MVRPVHLTSIRPLVRYVDEEQAVIDTHLAASPSLPQSGEPLYPTVDVMLEVDGSDGFHDEGVVRLRLVDGAASMRWEMVQPQRWWPAGMGEQPLYQLTARAIVNDELTDEKTITFGLTSVRSDRVADEPSDVHLLVNGRICSVRSVLMVDAVDEGGLLPATGDSLLLVRDHYGPNLLYEAADRAGILLVQCVPISPEGTPEVDLETQVQRLSPHPSLAGWFVGHLGRMSDAAAACIAKLDPAHTVFRDLPVRPAA